MKRLTVVKKMVPMMLVIVMLFSLVACNNDTGDTGTEELKATEPTKEETAEKNTEETEATETIEEEREPITVTYLIAEPGASSHNNFNDSSIAKVIKEQLNITLEIIEADENKYNVIIASGDVPDIIRAGPGNFDQLIQGNIVIPMDDFIDTYGKNILSNVPETINVSRKFWSNDTGNLYFLPPQIGQASMGPENGLGPVVRWDLYKQAGAPKINNNDELLGVLAEMVKANPESENGKTVYGVSGWADWGPWQYQYPMFAITGYYGGISTEINTDTNEMRAMLTDTSSTFWTSVDFYYKANQLGIMDPDMFTQKFDDFTAKCTAGQVLFAPALFAAGDYNANNASEGRGYATLPLEYAAAWSGMNNVLGWAGHSLGITKNAEHPERIMELFDFLYSYEGARIMYSGAQGETWDVVDGVAKLNDAVIEAAANGEDLMEKYGIGWNNNFIGFSPQTINPNDGLAVSLFETQNVYQTMNNQLQKDYNAHYGITYPAEIFHKLIESGQITDQSNFDSAANSTKEQPGDDISRISAKLNDLAMSVAAQCILSETDDEYEKNVQDGIEKFLDAGYQDVVDFEMKAWEDAREEIKSIMN